MQAAMLAGLGLNVPDAKPAKEVDEVKMTAAQAKRERKAKARLEQEARSAKK